MEKIAVDHFLINTFFLSLFSSASEGLIHIADCLLTHTCHNVPIPSAITEDLMARIGAELEFMWYASYSYPTIQEYSKVGIGFLIGEIWEVRCHEVHVYL